MDEAKRHPVRDGFGLRGDDGPGRSSLVEGVAGIEGEGAGGYAGEMSPEYQAALALRQPVSTADLAIVDGWDQPDDTGGSN